MSENIEKSSVAERLEKMRKDNEGKKGITEEFTQDAVVVKPLSFADIAAKLKARKEEEMAGANDDYTKDTIYIRKDIYEAFNALCIKHGDKKKFANEAISDFIMKKYQEDAEEN